MKSNIKILDCTLRDGGYYNNWDFDETTVDSYIEAMNNLPIDYIEIGYRSIKLEGYLGEYFYLPVQTIKKIRNKSSKKTVIILNEKDIRIEHLEDILGDCIGLIDLVRIAVDPKNIKRAIVLAKGLKKMNFEVGFNIMYMSTWFDEKDFFESLPEVNNVADFFYMVDSFGGVYPNDVIKTYKRIKKDLTIQIGFHGHNNLELALINTLTAINCGVDIVDSTITGMGRGAGNLKTELLLTHLSSKENIKINFNSLSSVVDVFSVLQEKYKWGTNLPYMVSGASSLPQKQVMEWVSNRFYSYNSIIRALNNKSQGVIDNERLEYFKINKNYDKILIIGGGASVEKSFNFIESFLIKNSDTLIIHSSSRNASLFSKLKNDQIFCLLGNEGYRMEKVFENNLPIASKCILPPYPRLMGTYIPIKMKDRSYELDKIVFKSIDDVSHTSIASQTAINFCPKEIYVVGYDGYSNSISKKDQELFIENNSLFHELKDLGFNLISLTKTDYSNLTSGSIYSEIV